MRFRGRLLIVSLVVLVSLGLLFLYLGSRRPDRVPERITTEGSRLIDSLGQPVQVTGINWFGMETEDLAPHGLWARHWNSMLDQVAALGFNTIRLPFSPALLDEGSVASSIDYELNRDLVGKTPLEILDTVIDGARDRGLRVILARQVPDGQSIAPLWYTSQYGDDRFISDWTTIAKRYRGNGTVLGADLGNEPHAPATWGSDDPRTDWRLAAERAGNAIHAVNPDWIIIVQGIDTIDGQSAWWGSNLSAVREYPVRLLQPNRLMYSAHDYGASMWPQAWFQAPDFPQNLPQIWQDNWGYLAAENIAPVLIGQTGGGTSATDELWLTELIMYLRDRQIGYTFWALNPNSLETGGILQPDWKTVDQEKLDVLKHYQAARLSTE